MSIAFHRYAAQAGRVYRGLVLELGSEDAFVWLRMVKDHHLDTAAGYLADEIDRGGTGNWWSFDRKTADDYSHRFQIYMNGNLNVPIVLTGEVDEGDLDPDMKGFQDQAPFVVRAQGTVEVSTLSVRMPEPELALKLQQQAMETLEQPSYDEYIYGQSWIDMPLHRMFTVTRIV